MLTGAPGHWLRKLNKESIKLKVILFRLLMSWLYKFQHNITIFVLLTRAPGIPVNISLSLLIG